MCHPDISTLDNRLNSPELRRTTLLLSPSSYPPSISFSWLKPKLRVAVHEYSYLGWPHQSRVRLLPLLILPPEDYTADCERGEIVVCKVNEGCDGRRHDSWWTAVGSMAVKNTLTQIGRYPWHSLESSLYCTSLRTHCIVQSIQSPFFNFRSQSSSANEEHKYNVKLTKVLRLHTTE